MSLDFLAPSIGIIKAIRCNGNVLDTGHCEEIPDNIYYRIEFQLSDGIHVAEWVQPDNVRPVRAPFAIRSASVNDNCVIQWMTGKARFLIFESLPDPIICGEPPPGESP